MFACFLNQLFCFDILVMFLFSYMVFVCAFWVICLWVLFPIGLVCFVFLSCLVDSVCFLFGDIF